MELGIAAGKKIFFGHQYRPTLWRSRGKIGGNRIF